MKAAPKLLEPLMRVEVVTPEDYVGDVMGDLNARRGQITGTEPRGNASVITAMSGRLVGVALELAASDHAAVDRVGAVGEAQGAQVQPHARKRRVLADAHAAVHLDRLVGDLHRHPRGDDLDLADPGLGRLDADRVHHVGRLEAEQARHLDLDAALGDDVAIGAEIGEPPAEGGAVEPRVQNMDVNGMPVTVVELRGSYARGVGTGPAGPAEPDQVLLASIVESSQGNIYIQLHGPAETVAKNREAYMQFIRNIRP